MFDNVRADLAAARMWNSPSLLGELLNPCTQVVLIYRFGHWAWKLRVPVVRRLLLVLYFFLAYFSRVMGSYIDPRAEIGPGFIIHSAGGINVPPVRIGRNLVLQTGSQINWNCRGIGDDVTIGPGAKIGADITIGHRVKIGPNAVVTTDVPDDTTIVVLPPRMLRVNLRERRRPPVESRTS